STLFFLRICPTPSSHLFPYTTLFRSFFQLARDEIHRGRADEARDKARRRVVVEFVRRADLLDAAVIHHHDAVSQGHRLDLVVGRSEEHTSELQSLTNLVCRLLLEKKK